MKTRLRLILLPFDDPESLSRTSLPALLVIGMMKYSSTVKLRMVSDIFCNEIIQNC